MKMSRATFLRTSLAATAGLMAAPGLLRAQSTKIRFATEAAYPPFNQTSPNGAITGYEPDLIAELAKRQGFEFELVSQAWDGMIQGLVDGKYDAVADAVTITPKRLEVVDFSLPYSSGGSAFVALKESGLAIEGTGTPLSLDDKAATDAAIENVVKLLKGKVVGVQVSTIQSDFLTTYLGDKGVEIRTYQAGAEAYQDLLVGRSDMVMSSITNLSAFLKKNGEEAAITGPTFGGGLMGKGSGIAVQKGNDALRAKLDAGLKSMSDDGTLSALAVKWFGLDISPKL